ncbi:helix-turn-helix transcriptional regulator [Saccharothrix australiensis]|uniref:Uncharacterized protein n=1 Tax=Saccharothrix australiensis TaxID=2072 RepID=A0A495VY24_9PSEU|nr:helix-turn-helix transcriptional regulator [Saccharothrix australiensis]RKT54331.1 hypothetical protein C8E97_2947 [Saccharothrix australiensis]
MAVRPSGADHEVDVLLRTGPFYEALRAAIERSGLTLERLRDRLARRGIHVSLSTLSYWRLGRSRPERAESLRAVQAIEVILGLPRHSLESLLGPPRPRGRWVAGQRQPRRYGRMLEPAQSLAETVEALVGPSDGDLRLWSQDDAAGVDARGVIREVRTRQVLRAVDGHPDRHVAVYCADPGTAPDAITVEAVANCRLGRVRRHHRAPVIAVELLFDHTLRAGQTHLLEYRFTVAEGAVALDYRRAFRYPVGTYVLSVRFTEPRLPVRCFDLVQSGAEGALTHGRELALTPGRMLHLVARDVPPGVLGIGWEWT